MIRVKRVKPTIQPDYMIILSPEDAQWLVNQMDVIVQNIHQRWAGDRTRARELGKAILGAKTMAELQQGPSAYE